MTTPRLDPLPLAAASVRLRGKPGRPRRAGGAVAPQAPAPPSDPRQTRGSGDPVPGLCPPSAVAPLVPRLLDLDATARYLGVSGWTVRDLVAVGVLPRVRVPLPHGGELRRLLFDREDLDRLISGWKDRRAP